MKSNISNTKIKYILLSIIFSILFIITALQFQTPLITQARPAAAAGLAELIYNPSTGRWEASGKGESGEKDYITVAEPMTEHDSIIAVLTFPEDGNAPVGGIQILAQDAEGLDGLQYGNWEFSVYANE